MRGVQSWTGWEGCEAPARPAGRVQGGRGAGARGCDTRPTDRATSPPARERKPRILRIAGIRREGEGMTPPTRPGSAAFASTEGRSWQGAPLSRAASCLQRAEETPFSKARRRRTGGELAVAPRRVAPQRSAGRHPDALTSSRPHLSFVSRFPFHVSRWAGGRGPGAGGGT